jgi:7,8-dihydropterin-6-yl-methyl-4-(beta-D-ribofuranosyl)aminobenzene 5'-phosphate synthase
MTILYDNYVYTQGTIPDWGFSCHIQGMEKIILFDTGTKADILFHNAEMLHVRLDNIEVIVLSHIHKDHTGGLLPLLEMNPDIPVYYPASFPGYYDNMMTEKDCNPVRIKESIEICANVHSTGEMGTSIKEQSLIIDTNKGLVIITGCSHQGIVNILTKAKEIVNKEIYLVFGGFHLLFHSESEIKEIIQEFKKHGVKKCGGTHCTGDSAIGLFKNAYGDDYISMGVGKIIRLSLE